MGDDFDNWLAGREREEPVDDGCMLRPGQRIDAYRIVRQLGVGGMGQVYEAEHVALGVRRALKVFSTESRHFEFLRKRFVAEGRILAGLQHSRIVRVYNLILDENSGKAYFEMDLVLSPDGEPRTLADELQDGADEEKIVGWFEDICEGLAYIHSRGIVHRDISLDNILIGRDGRAVITDFGIAKIIDDQYRKKIGVTATTVYKDGSEVRIGKERYMAPELKKPNGRASFDTDAWALGVLLFRMLSGSWYDVGTRLEDWHADLKYDWSPIIAQLCNVKPEKRLGKGGVRSLMALLCRKDIAWRLAEDVVHRFVIDKNTGRKTVEIVKARKANGDFTIPAEIDGFSVTSIGELAFADCGKMTSVVIPPGVTSIGAMAFFGCDRINSIVIPAGVTSIGEKAFWGCSRLKSVTIPNSVASIGLGAFEGCDNLRDIAVPQCVCNDSIASIIPSVCRHSTKVIILDGVTSIGASAFSYCRGIKSVVMPDSVTSIGESAFLGCSGMTTVTIGNGVASIEAGAFSYCRGLENVAIPDSVRSVGESAFLGCSSLATVTIGNGVMSIGANAFSGCNELSGVAIPNSVANVGDSAFADCGGLKYVTIGNGVTNIGDGSFSYCRGIKDVVIPDSVTRIGESAFFSCSGLTTATIGNGVKSIGARAFAGCGKLTNVTIPESVMSIGGLAFTDCIGLTSITIPRGVTRIEDGMFSNCYALASVRIRGGVTSIGRGAFFRCWGLADVTIPNSMRSMDENAFAYCRSLTNIVLPDSIIRIGDSAFSHCQRLASVTMLGNAPILGHSCFDRCNENCTVYVRGDSTRWMVDIPGVWNGVKIEYMGEEAMLAAFSKVEAVKEANVVDTIRVADDDTPKVMNCGSENLRGKLMTLGDDMIDSEEISAVANEEVATEHETVDGVMWTYCIVAGEAKIYGGSSAKAAIPVETSGDLAIPSALGGCPVTCIESFAFNGCKCLTSVKIPDSVKRIETHAFSQCSSLTTVTISSDVTWVDNYAFPGCRKLSEFIVADDNPVFKSLSGLLLAAENGEEHLVAGVNGDVTIPNGVTGILEGAFLGYSGLTSVTIPDTVTSIGDGAFGCSGLTTVSIGNGVTSIGERAFDCCFGLKSVSVPVGHADRIKGLFLDSGHKIDSIEFVERKADEK